MLSAGNDAQFATLCTPALFDQSTWVQDERFSTNANRVKHRDMLIPMIESVLAERTTEEWCKRLSGKG